MTSTLTTPLPTGRQHVLELGDQRAVVAAVGASLREYTVGGRDVVLPYDEDAMAPAFSGTVLAPWPNRLRDGVSPFEGVNYDVPLNEHDRQTALHGLVAHTTFEHGRRVRPTSVTLEHVVVPTHGYPWPVRIRVTYSLTATGLRVQTDVTNLGDVDGAVRARLPPVAVARRRAVDDSDAAGRRHPARHRRRRVCCPPGPRRSRATFDLRATTPCAGIALDDAWVEPIRDADGLTWVRFGGPTGAPSRCGPMRASEAWQVCTGDFVDAIQRRGVAVEPMTCIADAFRTGDDLIAPGAGREPRAHLGSRSSSDGDWRSDRPAGRRRVSRRSTRRRP